MTPSSSRKPWYSRLTVENLTKYLVFAGLITGMLTTVGRIVAVPYIKDQIDAGIEENNKKFLRVIDDKYADKNQLLKSIYEMQKNTSDEISTIKEKVAKIEGKLSK